MEIQKLGIAINKFIATVHKAEDEVHNIHLKASGEGFSDLHNVSNEYYEKLEEYYDNLYETLIAMNIIDVSSPTNANEIANGIISSDEKQAFTKMAGFKDIYRIFSTLLDNASELHKEIEDREEESIDPVIDKNLLIFKLELEEFIRFLVKEGAYKTKHRIEQSEMGNGDNFSLGGAWDVAKKIYRPVAGTISMVGTITTAIALINQLASKFKQENPQRKKQMVIQELQKRGVNLNDPQIQAKLNNMSNPNGDPEAVTAIKKEGDKVTEASIQPATATEPTAKFQIDQMSPDLFDSFRLAVDNEGKEKGIKILQEKYGKDASGIVEYYLHQSSSFNKSDNVKFSNGEMIEDVNKLDQDISSGLNLQGEDKLNLIKQSGKITKEENNFSNQSGSEQKKGKRNVVIVEDTVNFDLLNKIQKHWEGKNDQSSMARNIVQGVKGSIGDASDTLAKEGFTKEGIANAGRVLMGGIAKGANTNVIPKMGFLKRKYYGRKNASEEQKKTLSDYNNMRKNMNNPLRLNLYNQNNSSAPSNSKPASAATTSQRKSPELQDGIKSGETVKPGSFSREKRQLVIVDDTNFSTLENVKKKYNLTKNSLMTLKDKSLELMNKATDLKNNYITTPERLNNRGYNLGYNLVTAPANFIAKKISEKI